MSFKINFHTPRLYLGWGTALININCYGWPKWHVRYVTMWSPWNAVFITWGGETEIININCEHGGNEWRPHPSWDDMDNDTCEHYYPSDE